MQPSLPGIRVTEIEGGISSSGTRVTFIAWMTHFEDDDRVVIVVNMTHRNLSSTHETTLEFSESIGGHTGHNEAHIIVNSFGLTSRRISSFADLMMGELSTILAEDSIAVQTELRRGLVMVREVLRLLHFQPWEEHGLRIFPREGVAVLWLSVAEPHPDLGSHHRFIVDIFVADLETSQGSPIA